MVTQKQYDTTLKEEIGKQHGAVMSSGEESVMLERILECPNCTSLLRAWYQSTVTRITCPKCRTEIQIGYPQIRRSKVTMMG